MQKAVLIGSIFVGILALFVSISLVAATCTNDNQIILKLSSTTNAHAEIHNGAGSYPISVCYNDLFGTAYTATSNPWACLNNNNVISLSSTTNAHAASTAQLGYSTQICYGDLSCRVTSGECNLVGEKMVVSLSSTTNAHVASDASYPNNKVCCVPSSAPISENCGNTIVDSGETCDDGNNVNNDGCSSRCQLEPGCYSVLSGWTAGSTGKDCGAQFSRISDNHFRFTQNECNESSSHFISDNKTTLHGDFNLSLNFTSLGLASHPNLPQRSASILGLAIYFLESPGAFDQPFAQLSIGTSQDAANGVVQDDSSLLVWGAYNHNYTASVNAITARNSTLAEQISPGAGVTYSQTITGVRIERTGNVLRYYSKSSSGEALFSTINNISQADSFEIRFTGWSGATLNEYNSSFTIKENYISPKTTADFVYTINGGKYSCSSNYTCSSDGRYLFELKGGNVFRNWSTDTTIGCAGADGLTGGNNSQDDCCPRNLLCSTNPAGCRIVQQYTSCSQITNQNECNSAPSQVYSDDSVYGKCGESYAGSDSCSYRINCLNCYWNSTESNCTLRTQNQKIASSCGSSVFDPTICSHTFSFLGECSNGTMTRTVKDIASILSGPTSESCADRTYSISCGTSTLEASFFSSFNVIVILVSIVLIYAIYIQLNKRLK